MGAEAYTLQISEAAGVEMVASEASGAFYGVQSLLALAKADTYKEKIKTLDLPTLAISDAPRFSYRGLHVDVSRNFQSKAALLKIIDVMSVYKLNKIHLHLTDDEGWRLEIDALPELTTVGAKRGHSPSEDTHLQPAYGSGPMVDKAPGSGYYTKADFIEILRYAHARHVEVIPELNMPGHARAAIKSMEARYRRLMEAGQTEAAEAYLLTDFEDKSAYLSAQFYTDNTVCVCKESVYRFYEVAVDAVIAMYQEAGVPLSTIHTGGDEVPLGVWEASPDCAELIAQNADLSSAADLQNYFLGRISKILSDRDLVTAGWEEIIMKKLPAGGWEPNTNYADTEILAYVWNNLWGIKTWAIALPMRAMT